MKAGFFSYRTTIIAVIFLLAICVTAIAAQNPQATESKGETAPGITIRIGVLTMSTTSGNNHYAGIEEALGEKSKFGAVTRHIELIRYYYPDEAKNGFGILKNLIQKPEDEREVDIILGPTESDIFVRAVSQEKEFAVNMVPVISGLVTAKVGNRSGGWFFRTNVDVSRRAQTIYDYLNKHWFSTIAVIYADTEFGRRAERAFVEELKRDGREGEYLSLLYDTPPDPRKQLHSIFENRPEAVGVFGEREDVELVYNEFKRMNRSWRPYRPVFFTILDVRSLKERLDDIYFVSLTGTADETEVKALGYDLGILVIRVLEAMNHDGKLFESKFDAKKRDAFRQQLTTVMRNSGQLRGNRTGMTFNNFENIAMPKVFHLEDKKAPLEAIPEYIGGCRKFGHKFMLIFNVYGFWMMLIILGMIALLAFSVSRMEIKRLFPQKHVKIYKTPVFYLYLASHFAAVLLIYIFLAETGRIKYDDIVTVLVVSLTPSAFLRTTFFETKYGKAIGMEGIYKSLMAMLEDRVMKFRYKELEAKINTIAYRNSLDAMRDALIQVYKNHPSKTQRANLIQKMEEDIQSEPKYFEKRKVLAKLLLRQFDGDQLRAEGFLPHGWDYNKPFDPRRVVRMVARYCAKDPMKEKVIKDKLKEELEKLKIQNPDRYKEITDFMAAEEKDSFSLGGMLQVKIRILIVLVGFDIDWLIENKLLTKEMLSKIEESAGNGEVKKRWWHRWFPPHKKS